MVVCESVPTRVSGYAIFDSIDDGREDAARQVFQVDLVADAHARGHGAEVAEGSPAPT